MLEKLRVSWQDLLALAVLPDGTREILGIWIEQTEGAKFWMKVFTDLKTRGCHDILIAVTDGLKGMSEALGAVFPATTLQAARAAFPFRSRGAGRRRQGKQRGDLGGQRLAVRVGKVQTSAIGSERLEGTTPFSAATARPAGWNVSRLTRHP